MQRKILILGGYGNFGKRIAEALTSAGIPVIIAGRHAEKAAACVSALPENFSEAACFDVFDSLGEQINKYNPAVVINTCGPFQSRDYSVPQCCIEYGVHYIDLADGRDFVSGITNLDLHAKLKKISVISGASTVPGLSSAVIEHFKHEFSMIETLQFGISPGQQAERGLATTQGILSYVGKPLKPIPGNVQPAYGWQDVYQQSYPILGKRWMANCDIPDLDLLPAHYNIGEIRFSAGLELGFMHLGLWGLSWLVRFGVPIKLDKYAEVLLKTSNLFDRFGSSNGGMHITLTGKDNNGQFHQRAWFIIALNGYGPYIPTIPVVVLTKKLLKENTLPSGAMPCIGLVSLQEYLDELSSYPITTHTQ